MNTEFTKSEQALMEYFRKGIILAESLKDEIQKGLDLKPSTVIALNEFIIAAHGVADLQFQLEKRSLKLN